MFDDHRKPKYIRSTDSQHEAASLFSKSLQGAVSESTAQNLQHIKTASIQKEMDGYKQEFFISDNNLKADLIFNAITPNAGTPSNANIGL